MLCAHEIAGPTWSTSTVYQILLELQYLIWARKNKFFIQHIRAHTNLPGPMTSNNALVDANTRREFIFHVALVVLARDFHQKFHVPAFTLQQKFNISRATACDMVLSCQNCFQFHHPPRGD